MSVFTWLVIFLIRDCVQQKRNLVSYVADLIYKALFLLAARKVTTSGKK